MKTIKLFYRQASVLLLSASLLACAPKFNRPLSGGGIGASNINYAANQLESFDKNELAKLKNSWNNKWDSPFVVAHFGDSHIQNGWQIAPLRRQLQQVRGNAGRGMIFPYAVAKTYSQEDYSSHFSGNWKTANSIQQPPKIGVGVSGFVARTEDANASLNIHFNQSTIIGDDIELTLYYRLISGKYQLQIDNGKETQTLQPSPSETLQAYRMAFKGSQRDLNIHLQRLSETASIEIHGLSIQRTNSIGVIYHNLGVGGANYKTILQQKHFASSFPTLNADLVILDWGTNDILYENSIPLNFTSTVKATIQLVRSLNPKAAIILTSVQESNWKQKPTTAAKQYAELLRQIAKEEHTLFYDWYSISGGHGSMPIWQRENYASKDGIHLNGRGYRVKGELFAEAILNALQ